MIRLQQLRLDKCLSVPELAEKAGVTPKVIYRLEATGRAGHTRQLGKIAAALDVERASELLMPALPPVREPAA